MEEILIREVVVGKRQVQMEQVKINFKISVIWQNH